MYWSQINANSEMKVQQCEECQINHKLAASASIHEWTYPSTPLSRVNLDDVTPEDGKMLLIIVNAFSKWV